MEAEFDKNKLHIRNCMLYEYFQGKNATQASQKICSIYEEDILSIRMCQNWFRRFRDYNYCLEDEEKSGRPSEISRDELQEIMTEDSRLSTRQIAEKLEVYHTTVLRKLHDMGKVQKSGIWVPHILKEHNKTQRLNICLQLQARFKKKDFLWKIVTGDEKWVYFSNPFNKKQWLSPGENPDFIVKKNNLPKKVMICVWWGLQRIIYYELLEPNETINSERYSQQLGRLSQEIALRRPFTGKGKRPIILLHDNARPHVSKLTTKVIQELGWEVLPHPAYSPDIAPSDYFLFQSMEGALFTRKIIQLNQKSQKFY